MIGALGDWIMKKYAHLFFMPLLLVACTPTVKIEAPDKPIEINMNVKIEQEVRIKVEKDIDAKILSNPDLFGVPTTPTTKK
jgi:hypothetical protein